MGESERPYPVPSSRAIIIGGAVLVVLGVGLAILLMVTPGDGKHADQLDAIKTAGTIVVGTGGAAALWLAARRQRTTEIALNHEAPRPAGHRRANQHTVFDAEARRITDLYGKAVEQIGSDKPAVRLAGFYALERLAQDNIGQRQTIVNVLCAYLRMPSETSVEEGEVRQPSSASSPRISATTTSTGPWKSISPVQRCPGLSSRTAAWRRRSSTASRSRDEPRN